MKTRFIPVALAAVALTLSACGGSKADLGFHVECVLLWWYGCFESGGHAV